MTRLAIILFMIGICPLQGLCTTYEEITSGLYYDYSPKWAPDGTEIVYASVHGPQKIWRVYVDGGKPMQVTFNDSTIDKSPAWSPLGDRIAYCRDSAWAEPRTSTIWMISPAGDFPEQVTFGHWDITPCWSPDASLIAFSRDYDLWIVSAAGGPPYQLTSGPDQDYSPDWSPNGNYIAFTRHRDDTTDVWIIDLNTAEESRLTDSPYQDALPTWSPDGCMIAYSGYFDGRSTIFAIPSTGGESVPVTHDFSRHASEPDWAPDLNRIAFRPLEHYCHIWIASELDLPTVRLTNGVEFRPVSFQGEVFLDSTVTINVADEAGVVIAGDCFGTEPSMVDDIVSLEIKHPDGSTAYFSHDYSEGCQGYLTELAPTYIGHLFEPGIDTVRVVLRDSCAELLGSTALYLVSKPAESGVPGPSEHLEDGLVLKVFPNPFADGISITACGDVATETSLRIYDVNGRMMMDLLQSDATGQFDGLRWDGIDSRGQPVPPGIYFLRFESDGQVAKKKVVLVR